MRKICHNSNKMGGGSRRRYKWGGNYTGSSYTAGPSKREITELEKFVKSEIENKKIESRRRIFISFKFEDKRLVDFLRGQAKNKNSELDFIDMSLKYPFNSENAEYIRRGIRARIEKCSVTLVMATKETYKSEWVNWEIKESLRLGKKVIVINKTEGGQMPSEVIRNKDKIKIVPWGHESIMDALTE